MFPNHLNDIFEKSDEYFMRIALREAQKAFDADEVPIGAIVVVNNNIVAKGYNQVELLKDSTAHAEIIALTTAYNVLGAKYLPDATLYVTLEPCLMCCGAIYWSKLGRIVYGASDEKNGYRKYVNQSPFHPKTEIIHGVLQEECTALIKNFFSNKR